MCKLSHWTKRIALAGLLFVAVSLTACEEEDQGEEYVEQCDFICYVFVDCGWTDDSEEDCSNDCVDGMVDEAPAWKCLYGWYPGFEKGRCDMGDLETYDGCWEDI